MIPSKYADTLSKGESRAEVEVQRGTTDLQLTRELGAGAGECWRSCGPGAVCGRRSGAGRRRVLRGLGHVDDLQAVGGGDEGVAESHLHGAGVSDGLGGYALRPQWVVHVEHDDARKPGQVKFPIGLTKVTTETSGQGLLEVNLIPFYDPLLITGSISWSQSELPRRRKRRN